MRNLIALSLLALLFVAACGERGQPPAGERAAGKDADAGLVVLRRGNSSEPDTLDPHKAQGTWESNIIGDMFVGLTTDGPDGAPVPGAAESWTTSADGLTWTFKLRSGMTWSDGTPVTAEDFVYSLQRELDPKTGGQYAALVYFIKNAEGVNTGKMKPSALGVRAPDAFTLEISLEHPVPYLPEIAKHQTMAPVPKHIAEKFGTNWVKPDNIQVNGPYKLTEWLPNSHVKLVKNPSFYDAANVQIDVVYYYPIADSSIELKRYQTGELDLTNSMPARQVPWAREKMGSELHLQPYLALAYSQINVKHPPFDDVRVRKALALAVDREAICFQLLQAGQVPAYSLVPPGIANYPDGPQLAFESQPMEARKEEARALLKEAGFGPEKPLRFTYRYFDSVDDRRIAIALQDMWKSIGVEVELLNSEAKVQYDALRTQNFEVASAGWIADFNDAENFLFLLETSTGPMNYSQYSNPKFDALMAQANVTADIAERARLLAEAERVILEDFPIIPENFGAYRRLVKPYVKGWVDNVGNWHRTRYLSIDETARAR